jgi:serine/threonine protein kinase
VQNFVYRTKGDMADLVITDFGFAQAGWDVEKLMFNKKEEEKTKAPASASCKDVSDQEVDYVVAIVDDADVGGKAAAAGQSSGHDMRPKRQQRKCMPVITRVCGTPSYLAPEIVRFDDAKRAALAKYDSDPSELKRVYRKCAYDERADVWSMGVVMFVLFCGYAPFRGKLRGELRQKIADGDVIFLQVGGSHARLWQSSLRVPAML